MVYTGKLTFYSPIFFSGGGWVHTGIFLSGFNLNPDKKMPVWTHSRTQIVRDRTRNTWNRYKYGAVVACDLNPEVTVAGKFSAAK
jgi:hypothetical protein